ncbi:MAG: 50S ribosomal protein L9 [Spirochaetia bacterium]|jgi:large subunit ribosomal protein L9|nr:50S ribosomal protein L9 [Spirochaetales bacterium]
MKVILNHDVAGLGEEGDIRDVTNGYARNYLIPKKFALAYTKHNLTQIESRRAAIEQRKEEKRKEAMGIKERLESEELTFTMPAGDSGKLFGSVNNAMVVQELENRGYTIEKKRVEVPEHNIRVVGNYTVKVKLYGNEEAQINVLVEAAEEK